MGMVKLLTPGSQDFQEPVAQLVRISSRGLIGNDRTAFIKRAGAEFVHKIASLKVPDDEEWIHLLAVGATESYGPNRNGDGFRRHVCRNHHPSFTKYARWYRSHQNKDPSKSYGVVKESAFNGDMDRIELLVALNKTAEAARRNGGLVADLEMEKLASGKEIPVSMSCLVSHDVCSGCGHRAKTRKYYCDEGMCKYGGLKKNIAKVFDDGHVLHADNPDPRFFDISDVFRPADRIGYVLGKAAEHQLMKAAAADDPSMCGAALAASCGITAPLWLLQEGPWADRQLVGQLKVAEDLVALEHVVATGSPSTLDRACAPEVQRPVNDFPEMRKGTYKVAHVLAALAKQRCMLPIADFVALLSEEDPQRVEKAAEAAAAELPGIFTRLAEDPELERKLANNPYMEHAVAPSRLRHWVLKHASAWSLERPRVVERLQLSSLRSVQAPQLRPMKKEAADSRADNLAQEYALYQLAFLQGQEDADQAAFERELAVRHNLVA